MDAQVRLSFAPRARALSLGCLSTQFSSVCIVISGGKKLVGARARALSLSDVCVLNTQVSAKSYPVSRDDERQGVAALAASSTPYGQKGRGAHSNYRGAVQQN